MSEGPLYVVSRRLIDVFDGIQARNGVCPQRLKSLEDERNWVYQCVLRAMEAPHVDCCVLRTSQVSHPRAIILWLEMENGLRCVTEEDGTIMVYWHRISASK